MSKLRWIFIGIILILLYAPIIVMIVFSFNEANSTSIFEGFSLRWYKDLFQYGGDLLGALRNTLVLAVLSSVISTVLGTVAAVGISKMKKAWVKSSVMSVTNIPLMNPEVVTGISMMLMFVFVGKMLDLANSVNFFTILIAHITFGLPYVILNVLPRLRSTDKHLTEAAMDLGCTPVQAFFKAVLPSITPGIIVGFIMAFTMSLDDFVISYFTNGTYQTLPLLIYSMTRKPMKPDVYALESIMFLIILVLMILLNVIQNDDKKKGARLKK
ncbi:MAG: ABC transporter permease [Clostridia bacterium]|nr:ABC transporter permease [Clostridia bacterium]